MKKRSRKTVEIRFRKKWLPLILLFVAVPWIITGHLVYRQVKETAENHNRLLDRLKVLHNSRRATVEGDWGQLEVTPMTIQPPVRFFGPEQNYGRTREWNFSNCSLDSLRAIFRGSGLERNETDLLVHSTRASPEINGLVTSPPDSLLWRLSPEERSRLYAVIGAFPNNALHWAPFRYDCRSAKEWLANSRLPKNIMREARKLFYVRNGKYCFTDLHLMEPLLKNPVYRMRFLRMLLRSQALDVSLKIGHGADIQKTIEYWGRFARTEIVEQHFETLRSLPRGGSLDLIHLLPPIPRSRLNTYMMQQEIDENKLRDCGWIMFNFFNQQEDGRFDDQSCRARLVDAISQSPTNPQKLKFGDMLHFVNNRNEAVHTCIHIADGIVLTKNGIYPQYPFKFDYLARVVEFYSFFENVRVVARERRIAQTQSVVENTVKNTP